MNSGPAWATGDTVSNNNNPPPKKSGHLSPSIKSQKKRPKGLLAGPKENQQERLDLDESPLLA